MIPALIAAAAAKTLGGLVGGVGQYNDTQQGATSFRNLAARGVGQLQQGKQEANQAFAPYTGAGVEGVSGQTAATQGYLGNVGKAPGAEGYKTTAGGVSEWLNPSAAYSTDQASRAIQASALAKGGVGGGLARALSNNASQMAITNWNNAAAQQQGANAQNFGQASSEWSNNKAAQDANLGHWSNLANMGLQATGANQNLQGQYNTGINENWLKQADATQGAWNSKGKIFNDTATGFGNNIGGGITSIWGGGK